MSFEQKLQEYASLIVSQGLNVQPGQTVSIAAPVECAPLARMCAALIYQAGAREVVLNWRDETISRLRYLHADSAVFDAPPAWLGPMYDDYLEKNAARLVILGSDPESLKGVDPDRLRREQQASYPVVKAYSEAQTADRFPWCIAAYPTRAWAARVFPELSADDAVNKLWDYIFAAVRVTGDGTAPASWQAHTTRQKQQVKALNDYAFVSLHYKTGAGTDLTVGLPTGHYWMGGGSTASCNGKDFLPNIPTEEVFTLPHRDRVNGKVYGSMPLVHNGNIIDGFWFELKDGKIINLHADKGEEYLREAISLDEGAAYLGEVALVPFHSPIRDTGILFYETLFDENAACHFAFGRAYPLVEGAKDLSPEEQGKLGINQSITHVDFMIGTADLSITGTTADGREVPVFRAGNFVL